jgi:hypothetical protein
MGDAGPSPTISADGQLGQARSLRLLRAVKGVYYRRMNLLVGSNSYGHRPLLSGVTLATILGLGACVVAGCSGDDARESASDSATSGVTVGGTASESATDSESAGSESASESSNSGASESAGTGTTSETAGETSTSASGTTTSAGETESASDSSTSTTGGVGFCGDDPPDGYFGDFDTECKNEPQVGTFNPVIEWHKSTFEMLPGAASASAPIVVQLSDDNNDGLINDDDMPDVVYIAYSGGNGVLRAISGDGSKELINVNSVGLDRNKAIAGADIDGDGITELIASTTARKIIAFEHDGTVKWESAALTPHVGVYEVAPAISDMNGDGVPEIVVGRAILDNTGALIGAGTHGIGAGPHANGSASMSFAVDLDDDGDQEVVVGNALYNIAGGDIWFNGEADGYPAIGDFDLDGVAEIVVVSNGTLRLQASEDGSVLWSVAIPGGIGGPPTVADFDGDGLPEIGVAGKSRYSVFEGDGTVMWTNTTQDASSGITGSSVYDFEGDGIADVVYADEINLYVYAGNDGTVKLKLTEHNSGTRLEYPVIADVDNDDQVEIVFVSEPYNGNYAGITVVGDMDQSWRPGRRLWNQHAYHITNINDDGTVPQNAEQNWKSYNNFRSGDLSDNNGTAAPDLVVVAPESCVNECAGADLANFWVQLGNIGAVDLTAGATIEVYVTKMGVETLDQEVPFDQVLAPGEYADAVMIQVNTAGVDTVRIFANPKETECKVDPGDELVIEAPFCMIPG